MSDSQVVAREATAAIERGGDARRVVVLPDGRCLVVRPMVAADADGLGALYDRLSAEDKYRRFFTGCRPSDRFLHDWAAVGERGGFGLVAVVGDGDGDHERIVGETAYARLGNGDGEFAMTVDADWRGWLGPYLLDALVDAAAEQGIPNLEAEILVENRPMVALARHRGYAIIGQDDWTSMHVVIGTSGHTPSWPPLRSGPRVLVEIPSGHWSAAAEARASGLEVITCPGPESTAVTRCPLLNGDPCPLAQGADAIVVALPEDDPRGAAIRAAHPTVHPHALVWLQDPTGAIAQQPDEQAADSAVGAACSSAAEVVARIRAALSARNESR